MTNRKNHNSIIFLTTLSVYLGLVLVGGAAPSVFAQAATTRQFDIKNEIEVKDNLDKKPDENDLLTGTIIDLVQELNKFSDKIDHPAIEFARKIFAGESNAGREYIYSQKSGYKVTVNNKDLIISAKVPGLNEREAKNFQPFVSDLTNYLAQTRLKPKPAKAKSIAENTKVTFENNQVFIVTQLPRASIDELLTKDAR